MLPFFQPTFTQGLVIGQLSILILLGMILKYLFLESSQYPLETTSYHQQVDNDAFLRERDLKAPTINSNQDSDPFESTKWFNTLLSQVRIFPSVFRYFLNHLDQVVDVYRSKLRNDISGVEGDEFARKRIEAYANTVRPPGFVVCSLLHISLHIHPICSFRTTLQFIQLILVLPHPRYTMLGFEKTSQMYKYVLPPI